MGEDTCTLKNPCCMPLQKGVLIMACVNVALSVLRLIFVVVLMCLWLESPDAKDLQRYETGTIGARIAAQILAFFVYLTIMSLIILIFDVLLIFGAKNRNRCLCCVWMIVSIIYLFLCFIGYIWSFVDDIWILPALDIPFFIYRVYMVYCVCRFMQEIEEHGGKNPGGQKA